MNNGFTYGIITINKNKGYEMEAIRVSDGTREYESYAEAGRFNGFHGASLGYAFKHSGVKDTCKFRGKTWTKGAKLNGRTQYKIVGIALFLVVLAYFVTKG